jgi:hypothetical protein
MEWIFPLGLLMLMRIHGFVSQTTELAALLIYHRHEEGVAEFVDVEKMLLLKECSWQMLICLYFQNTESGIDDEDLTVNQGIVEIM